MSNAEQRFNQLTNYLIKQNLDMSQREIPFEGGRLRIFFIKQIIDVPLLSQNVIRPLINNCARSKKPITAEHALNRILFSSVCSVSKDDAAIVDLLLSGNVVILFSNDEQYLIVKLKRIEHRNISEPEIEYSLRGSKDCFIENLDVNISLIRYRIKDNMLRLKMIDVGKRTKTRIAIVYIEDIASDVLVGEIQKRIEDINIDGIVDSGEIHEFLLNKKFSLFPQMGLVERSDFACRLLLGGRVITLVDGSALALSAPATFLEFFYSCDDCYENKFFGMFMRIIRYISLFAALTASSLYVALTSFHTDALPSDYAILLAEMNAAVPFPSVVGAFLVEFLMEIIRESLLRVPRRIGSAIGVVGAIVIGQAAISSGLFSPLLLIIASLSLLTSFVVPDYTLVNAVRILKFILLLFTGLFGFYGFSIFMCLILAELVSINSFGLPYMVPLAPFNRYDFFRTFMGNITISPFRKKYMHNKNRKRTRKI